MLKGDGRKLLVTLGEVVGECRSIDASLNTRGSKWKLVELVRNLNVTGIIIILIIDHCRLRPYSFTENGFGRAITVINHLSGGSYNF